MIECWELVRLGGEGAVSFVGSRDGTNSRITERIGLIDAKLEPKSEALGLVEPVNDQEELRECILDEKKLIECLLSAVGEVGSGSPKEKPTSCPVIFPPNSNNAFFIAASYNYINRYIILTCKRYMPITMEITWDPVTSIIYIYIYKMQYVHTVVSHGINYVFISESGQYKNSTAPV